MDQFALNYYIRLNLLQNELPSGEIVELLV